MLPVTMGADWLLVAAPTFERARRTAASLVEFQPSVYVLGARERPITPPSDPRIPRLVVLDLHPCDASSRRMVEAIRDAGLCRPTVALTPHRLAWVGDETVQVGSLAELRAFVRGWRVGLRLGHGPRRPIDEEAWSSSPVVRIDGIRTVPVAGSEEIVGFGDAIRRLRRLVEKATRCESTVLLTGETGVGKERIARLLHRLGRRRDGPFVAVNCGAMAESLLDAELFGHEQGAFTDARRARTGLLVSGDGGMVFLDEVGEMPPAMQVRLLRALQQRSARRVGGLVEIPFDARVVSATNRPLEELLRQGRLRSDLYYRLAVVKIHVPALRDRGAADILLLAEEFLRELALAAGRLDPPELSPSSRVVLVRHGWPGNVRELRNCMERAVALAEGPLIEPDDLQLDPAPGAADDEASTETEGRGSAFGRRGSGVASFQPGNRVHQGVRDEQVLEAMQRAAGNKCKAARLLGVAAKRVHRRLRAMQGRSSD